VPAGARHRAVLLIAALAQEELRAQEIHLLAARIEQRVQQALHLG